MNEVLYVAQHEVLVLTLGKLTTEDVEVDAADVEPSAAVRHHSLSLVHL